MKSRLPIALAAAQLLAVTCPANAASVGQIGEMGEQRRGAFAGARLRLPLGHTSEKLHAGLSVSSLDRGKTGELRFSKGVELGFRGNRQLGLSFGGVPVEKLGKVGSRPSHDEQKAGISTLGWIGIGAGVALVAGAIWFTDAMNDPHD